VTSGAPADEPVVVGRIAGAYGVLGWVRLVSYTDPPENLLDYRPWLLGNGSRWQPVSPATGRAHGDGFIVQLRELSSREQAQALAGSLIAVPRSALPALDQEDEFYWRDLVGMAVYDRSGRQLGVVDHLLDTGAHEVLVIRTESPPDDAGASEAPSESSKAAQADARFDNTRGRARGAKGADLLIPFLRQFVPVVDPVQRRLVVDWQEPV
jgi:16S rRNA processing protein RimM